MLEGDLLGDVPVLLIAFNVAEHFVVLTEELLADYLCAFLIDVHLMSLLNLLLFVCLYLLELLGPLALKLLTNVVKGFLDGLASVRACASRAVAFR